MCDDFYDSWAATHNLKRRTWLFGLIRESNASLRARILKESAK